MALTGKSREQIRVAVQLPLALDRFAAQDQAAAALKQHLLRSLNELVDALAIPAEIVLDVSCADQLDGIEIAHYEVVVDGVRCRLRAGASIESEIEPRALARTLAWDVCRNRELLVSPALCERIWGEWCSAQRATPLGEEELRKFHEFLTLLVRRGFCIDRGYWVVRKRELSARTDWSPAEAFEQSVGQLDALRIQLWFGQDPGAPSRADDMPLEQMPDMMRDGLFYELGLNLPKVEVHHVDDGLVDREFRIQLNDLYLPPIAGLCADQFLVNVTTQELAQRGVSGSPAVNPANGNRCSIVTDRTDILEKCRDAGYTTWGPAGYMVLHLAGQIRSNAGSLIDTEVLDYQLRILLRDAFPDLVEAALKRFGVTTLTRIIRELLDEEISVRDLRAILESLLAIEGTINADWAERVVFLPSADNLCPAAGDKQLKDLNVGDYVSRVRMTMNRYISHNYTGGQNKLFAYLLAPQLEARIRACGQLPLSDAERRQITSAIFDLVGGNSESPPKPVVLTTFDVRRSVRDLLEREFPNLPVLSRQELAPGLTIEPLGRITPRFRFENEDAHPPQP
jgi:hypothetical protein